MKLVRTTNDIIENLEKMEGYLNGDDAAEKKLAGELVAKSDALVIYKVEGVNHFAPGRICPDLVLDNRHAACRRCIRGSRWFIA